MKTFICVLALAALAFGQSYDYRSDDEIRDREDETPMFTAAGAAIIRNEHSGLVLDSSETIVKVQFYTGLPSQLYDVIYNGNGRFYLKNRGKGHALDVQSGSAAKSGSFVVSRSLELGSTSQMWNIKEDHTIQNVAVNLVMDIKGANYAPDTEVIVYTQHGQPNQLFYFQHTQAAMAAGSQSLRGTGDIARYVL